jgi:phage baseplate assembly protein gpV
MANGFYIGGFLNQAPSVSIELTQSGVININASTVNISGSVSVGGSITAGGDVVGGGISLDSHVHGGVQSGGSTTSTPQ